jgi:hypothetical protein
MFIGHYKSVNSPNEFYSEKRSTLDFPTQVELFGERYLLNSTILISKSKQEKGLLEAAKRNDVKTNVKLN